ncbi:MAG TPA: enolase C-terminal domain-like protein, partial [Ktedonobacteraceae bacterium]|nr:enolase C-terminal domain-like protein [Ktedonobacteraceae bacterium]
MPVTIKDVRVILTMPDQHNRLVVVKVETSEPGLYGLGCATYTQRPFAVQTAVERYLKPFLIGKDVQRIEDLWQTMMVNPYWRNGPILNNAISGVDIALWDIKGKQANMPVYQLLGGKCREAAVVYGHADGRDEAEVAEHVQAFLDKGYRYIRCQWGGYGGKHSRLPSPEGALPGAYFDPAAYARNVPRLFAFLREQFGDEIELLHDVHERLPPIEAIGLAKRLEPYRLFFLEDPLRPEQGEWLKQLRQQCSVPIAF